MIENPKNVYKIHPVVRILLFARLAYYLELYLFYLRQGSNMFACCYDNSGTFTVFGGVSVCD